MAGVRRGEREWRTSLFHTSTFTQNLVCSRNGLQYVITDSFHPLNAQIRLYTYYIHPFVRLISASPPSYRRTRTSMRTPPTCCCTCRGRPPFSPRWKRGRPGASSWPGRWPRCRMPPDRRRRHPRLARGERICSTTARRSLGGERGRGASSNKRCKTLMQQKTFRATY